MQSKNKMYYKISEFSRLIGVSTVTLRRWELQGILKPHHKSPTGYRYYSEEQLNTYIAGKEEACKEQKSANKS